MEEQLSLQSSAFDILEKDFREVLNELVGDKSLERFRLEYEKLHHTLKKSHENEKRLIAKCRELNAEILANAAKVQTALRMSLQDQNSITLLKKEIDKAWAMVDGAQEKEKRARETIQRLKGEIQNLSRLVEQGAGISIGQENAVNDLLKVREELTRKVDTLTRNLEHAVEQSARQDAEAKEIEAKRQMSEKMCMQLKDTVSELKQEASREERRTERLQEEMVSIKKVNEVRKNEIAEQKAEVEKLEEAQAQLEEKLKRMAYSLSKYQTVSDELKTKNEDLERTADDHIRTEGELIAEKEQVNANLVRKSKDLKKARQKVQALMLVNEEMENEKKELLAAKTESERYKAWLKEEMKSILKSVDNQKRDAETDEKFIKDLQQQVKRLTASLRITQEKNSMQYRLVKDHDSIKMALEEDILAHKREEQKLRKRNYELEQQREKVSLSASNWNAKYHESVERYKLKEMEYVELQKAVQIERNKLKLQQGLYEQVRADRNLCSKKQLHSQDEIAEMKRKFVILTHQINQLKDEVLVKDNALVNEHFAFKTLKDKMKVNKRKLTKRKEVLATADKVLAQQDTEIKNLRRTLNEAEHAQHQRKRVYDDVVQERDILGMFPHSHFLSCFLTVVFVYCVLACFFALALGFFANM